MCKPVQLIRRPLLKVYDHRYGLDERDNPQNRAISPNVALREGPTITKPRPNVVGSGLCNALWQWHIFRGEFPLEYRLRWCVSLPCSGWERVGPHR
jgi:hypothetical protein